MVLTDEELLGKFLERIAPSFLVDCNPERNTQETASDLTDFFVRNFKRVGVARIVRGIAAGGLLAVVGVMAKEDDYKTLETICQVGIVFSGFYSFSAIDALISVYQHKDFLNTYAESIVRRYYLINKQF